MKRTIMIIRNAIAVVLVAAVAAMAVSIAPTAAEPTLLELATPAGIRLSPPEWPTSTPPPTDGYPGPEPTADPYPAPYPYPAPDAPAYLPVVMEAYP